MVNDWLSPRRTRLSTAHPTHGLAHRSLSGPEDRPGKSVKRNPLLRSRVRAKTGFRRFTLCWFLWLLAFWAIETISLGCEVKAEERASSDKSAPADSIDGPTETASWPHIRGPRWDGTSDESGLADQWPVQGPPVLWTRELGQGYSSFIAWKDRAVTQYQSLRGQFVVCVDANTGSTVWEYRYDWPYDPAGVYPGPRSTPTYSQGRIYFASPAGQVGCLNAETGMLLWSVSLAETFHGEITGFGYACSPTVVDDQVLLPVGGPHASMVSLNADTGAVVWQSGSDAGSYAPAYPVQRNGRPLVLGYLENVLVCHDRSTGELLWKHSLSQGYDEHSSWPLYQEPYLWISSPFRAGSELLELTDSPDSPVRSHGRRTAMSNDIFSSVLVDGAIYGFDVRDAQAKTHRSTRGTFRCLDFASGREHWSVGDDRALRSGDGSLPNTAVTADEKLIGHATVIAADGKLILFNDLGELILARATSERFEELSRTSVLSGEICWTQPALCGGRLFVRNHSRAACLFLRDADQLPDHLREGAITVSDIPQEQYFDWASVILGVEPEYAFDLPSATWLKLWYNVCLLGIMGTCTIIPLALLSLKVSPEARGLCYWSTVFIAGAAGTSLLSPLLNEFVFTWPVAVFAVYQPFIDRTSLTHRSLTSRQRLHSGIAGCIFVSVCVLYFLACRRLSLVFEWVFLTGFVAAVPFSVLGKILFSSRTWYPAWKFLSVIAAFTAFYWSAVGFLYLRVR